MTVLLPLSGQISRYSGNGMGNDGPVLRTLPTTGVTSLASYVRHGTSSPDDASYWTNENIATGPHRGWSYTTFEPITVSPTGVIQLTVRGKRVTGGTSFSFGETILWSRKEVNGTPQDIIVASGTAGASFSTASFTNTVITMNIIEANRTSFESGLPFYPTLSGLLTFNNTSSSGNYQLSELQLDVSGNIPSINASCNLYIGGHLPSSGSIPLYIANIGESSGSIPLYIGGLASSSGSITLYIAGPIETSGSIPLYIGGLSSGDSNFPLYTHGAFFANSGIDLYIGSFAQHSGTMNLYMQGAVGTSINNQMPLYLWSTEHSGIFKTMDMVLWQSSQFDPRNVMNLVMVGPTSIAATSYLNLFLENKDDEVASGLSLFLGNYWSNASGHIPLYMAAPEGTDGAVPFSGSLNLYMARNFDSVALAIPLFLKNYDYSSGNIPMYVFGANLANSSIPLYIRGQDGSPNDDIPLFTSGF